MTFIELTERYRGNSRAQRLIKHYRVAHEALSKLSRQLREERYPRFARDVDSMAASLVLGARVHCAAASMPITGEVVVAGHDAHARDGGGRS